MKNILDKFAKLADTHQLNEDCQAAMRGLLQQAHDAGYVKHMSIAQPAAVAAQLAAEAAAAAPAPDGEEDDNYAALRHVIKKTIRKELRKGLAAKQV
jgi:hypothetical protein